MRNRYSTTYLYANQPVWFNQICTYYARFAFQGDRQFSADVSCIMRIPFRVGSDGKECWYLGDKELEVCPFESIREKNVLFCDPFGSRKFSTPEKAIGELKLEYLGAEDFQGKTCHRIRSWKELVKEDDEDGLVGGICDWLIDAKTLLPVLEEEFLQGICVRNEFIYHRLNVPIPVEVFQRRPMPDSIASRSKSSRQAATVISSTPVTVATAG